MIGSSRTLLTAFAGLAAVAVAAPGFAGDASVPVQLAEARAAAPNFVGISKWFNSAPLSIGDLRGKVVLVDFWTYGCYNCVNTLPHVTKLYETYKDKGLVVVGIHTPEFPFERSAVNVQAALKRHSVTRLVQLPEISERRGSGLESRSENSVGSPGPGCPIGVKKCQVQTPQMRATARSAALAQRVASSAARGLVRILPAFGPIALAKSAWPLA